MSCSKKLNANSEALKFTNSRLLQMEKIAGGNFYGSCEN